MSNVDSKQVRAEIAAHGFADCMDRHGFRKVGATHWRRDSDEVTWRVALIDSGYERSPGSFNVVMGGLIPGLDALGSEVNGQPLSSPIRGLSARAHIHRDVGFNLYGDYHQGWWEPFDDDLPEPIRHPETLRRKYRGVRVDRLPEGQRLFETGQVVKHWGCASISASSLAFLVEDRDIREVARTVTCYFDLFFARDIERWLRFDAVYDEFYCEDSKFFWPQRLIENICAAWLKNDLGQIKRIIHPLFSKAESYQKHFKPMRFSDASGLQQSPLSSSTSHTYRGKNTNMEALYWAGQAAKACRALKIPTSFDNIKLRQIESLANEINGPMRRRRQP